MARGCVAICINNRGFAAGKDEFLVGRGVNRLVCGAPAIALPDNHLSLSHDAGELAASRTSADGSLGLAGFRPAGSGRWAEVCIQGLRYEFALLRGGSYAALEPRFGLVIPIGQ